MKRHRAGKQMSTAELARVTRIPVSSLEAIERDQFDGLPGEVFTRGFLKSYARAVGVGSSEVLARYGASRRVVIATPMPVAAPVQATSAARGRSFGVAIALVLLLILFTLAMSIVLKPRGHDMPSELSQAAPAATDVRLG